MIRNLPYLGFAAATFAAVFALLAWLELHGFAGHEMIALDGRGIATRDGLVVLREFALTFPPLPYLVTAGLQLVLPVEGVPAPAILSALLVAGLAATLVRSLVTAGYRWAGAIAMTGMLLAAPAFLYLATSTGPAAVLLAFAGWLVATSAYRLRARANIVDLMAFSCSLAFMALCHPLGVLIALGIIPFLILILPAQVTSESVAGAYLTVLFPFLLVAGGALYVSWIFTGDPVTLVRTLAAGAADAEFETAESVGGLPDGGLATAALLYVFLAVANAPMMFGALIGLRRRLPRAMPLVALAACVPCGALLGHALGLASPPVMMIAPLTGIAAATVAILPLHEQRPVMPLLLLAAGVVGSALSLRLMAGPEAAAWVSAMSGQVVPAMADADLAVGSALAGRQDIMIDTATAPGVVAGRRSARGLVTPLSVNFEIVRMSRRPATRFLAVRQRGRFNRERDAVHAIFPHLYRNGMAGYVRIYDHLGWRVYERRRSVAGM